MVVRAETNGIDVILATEVTVREPAGAMNWIASIVCRMLGKTSCQNTINQHVSDINKWLVQYSASRNIRILDIQAKLADTDNRRKPEFATDDGSHLTAAAYSTLTAYADDVLQWTCDDCE